MPKAKPMSPLKDSPEMPITKERVLHPHFQKYESHLKGEIRAVLTLRQHKIKVGFPSDFEKIF